MDRPENANLPDYIPDHIADLLPGQVYDTDDQCYIAYGTGACPQVCLLIP